MEAIKFGERETIAPTPATPTAISNASETAHIRQRTNTCWRSKPCRKMNAFCAPMAMISVAPRTNPYIPAEIKTNPFD